MTAQIKLSARYIIACCNEVRAVKNLYHFIWHKSLNNVHSCCCGGDLIRKKCYVIGATDGIFKKFSLVLAIKTLLWCISWQVFHSHTSKALRTRPKMISSKAFNQVMQNEFHYAKRLDYKRGRKFVFLYGNSYLYHLLGAGVPQWLA